MKKTISILVVVCLALAAQVIGADKPAAPAAAKPKASPTKAINDNQTYIICYFGAVADKNTEWALQPNNDWYIDTGAWQTTPVTGEEKYFTNTAQNTLLQACMQAGVYYGQDAPVTAYFAQTKNVGNPYPIVSQGVELFPNY